MSGRWTTTVAARRDLETISLHIAKENSSAAERFLAAARSAFDLLARYPLLGSAGAFRDPALHDLRIWSIKGFSNYLVLFRPAGPGVQIVRVVHGARDITTIDELR